ncbi:MAG: hypothetical protein JXR83_04340 [Deltaproteobacteria bacterium]|nr:hypothetical protein [Deltaproteobacteria bacterium]
MSCSNLRALHLELAASLLLAIACTEEKQPASAPASSRPAVTQPASAPASKPASAPAGEPVDLRGPGLKSGAVWSHSEQAVWQGAGRLTATRGPEQNGLAALQTSFDQRVEVMAATEDGMPVSVRVEHQRMQRVFEMNGERETTNAPYAGKTVDYRYDDLGACALIVKQEPKKKQPRKKKRRGRAAAEPEPEPEPETGASPDFGCPFIPHLLYPVKPVRPGESWSPSLEAVRLALGVQQDETLVVQANRMTLQKVDTEGERTAKITWDLQCTLTGADESVSEYVVKIMIQRSLVSYLDFDTRWQGKLADEVALNRGLIRMAGTFDMSARNEVAAHSSQAP